MDEVFGYIETILFTEELGGFTVARIKEPKKSELTCIVGIMPSLQPGESIRCKGVWKMHAKHGRQFEVSSFELEPPSDLVGIQKYLESGMIKGIGPAYAGRIVKTFGTETLQVIDETPDKLLEVAGIGVKRIDQIKRCWDDQRIIRSVMIFLRGHGVSPSFAQKIYKAYGSESVKKVMDNPYSLAKEIHGIGFKSADKIAMGLGIAKESPIRVDSGIEHVLWELSNEGHVCYPLKELLAEAQKILEVSEGLLGLRVEELVKAGQLVQDEEKVWVKPLYLSELGIARELSRLLMSPCALREVHCDNALSWVEEKLRIHFAKEQKHAIERGLCEKLLIITGGPGTGKSTITRAILTILEKLTSRIFLAAPTGRAAKRLTEITRKKALTIHSLLEMDFKGGGFKKNRDNPLNCDLIILDEVSMVDTLLMNHLLKAIPSHARVIFVGDTDQLPSVGPGNVLKEMIASQKLAVCELKEIFRQAKHSHIVVNAHKINQGEFPFLASPESHSDFIFYQADEPEEILKVILDLALTLPERYGFHTLEDIQVLSPMKRGIIGGENLNTQLQLLLNKNNEPLFRMGRKFLIGDKVMQIRNDYQKEVFNGDVGYIIKIDFSEQKLEVSFDNRLVSYDFDELDALVLSYAVSIHKYQGSECPCIIIPVHTSHFKLLHRNLLYTGITRGKKLVILVGSKKAIAIAVKNEEVRLRHCGLKRRIEETVLFNNVSR